MEPVDSKIAEKFRRVIVKFDIAFHIVAAILLLVAAGYILFHAALNILDPSRASIVHLINDVLLALIVLEILWTVNRFLKKKKFLLGPFLIIGVIAGVRRILLIEAQTSLTDHVDSTKLYEIGVSAMVVLVMMIAYYISLKAQKIE
ncbi:MAG TPA: phosphate-starvation-inducible PsiE family protein [Candidatus Scalindua sp.]|nr:phosphate-starvation-inducible PsiE family protein [Candidatus Scalindua sp.]|tara:strand:- start:208 stop:645 length:438 start_codon:yes stop_codon:yes gene_type:complete